MTIRTINKTGQQIAAEGYVSITNPKSTTGWVSVAGSSVVPPVPEKYEGYPMATDKLSELGAELDAKQYEWLLNNGYGEVADCIQLAVSRGTEPREIELYITREYGQERFASVCKAAARYLQRQAQ